MPSLGAVAKLDAMARKGGAMIAAELTRELADRQVAYEVLPHPHTETASAEANALGVPASEVGKTVVLVTPEGWARAVIPAGQRLDLHKVRDALGGGKEIRLATEAELASAYPMFELGAVPPIGGPVDRVVVDRRLAAHTLIVVEAGTHDESLRLSTEDLVRVAQADVLDIVVV
jgi:Ala-tRNA(Pro) deacylase